MGSVNLEAWCKQNNREDLLEEWHYTKNNGLRPCDFLKSSNKKVWWIVRYDDPITGKHFDFEWEARIQNRTDNNSGCPYLKGDKIWKGYNDFETWCHYNGKMNLLEEWDFEKNDINPDEIVAKGSRKIWWKCKKGHSWQVRAADRILSDTQCPICSLNRVKLGINDFATTNPSLLKEWDYEKNGELNPTNVMRGSHTEVFWKCSVCGYSWKSRIDKRAGRNDIIKKKCPVCEYNEELLSKNKSLILKKSVPGVNDLETWCIFNDRKELLEEWDYEKNNLSPSELTNASRKKVYWKCQKGHTWFSEIISRTKQGNGCPYCSNHKVWSGFNDLATTHPYLLSKWDYQKNTDIDPTQIMAGTRRKIYWIGECGHRWTSSALNMAYRGDGCPVCSGRYLESGVNDFETWCKENNRQDLLDEWDFAKNELKPNECHPHVKKKVWWICMKGHSFFQSIGSRTGSNIGCPKCSSERQTSFPEYAILYYLNEKGIYAEHSYKKLGYELDIFIPEKKIGIEFDGSHWHKNKIEQDLRKNKRCQEDGIKLYRLRIDIPSLNDTSIDYCCTERKKEEAIQIMLQNIIGESFDINFNRDNNRINQLRVFQEKENSVSIKFPEIAIEWHPIKNGKLTPDMFSYGSGQKVWWLGKCGHEWQASLQGRCSHNEGCPFCSNRRVLQGFNDLASKCPDLLAEWDYAKNDIKPSEVLFSSSKKVWWVCAVCKNTWQTSIDLRTISKSGCPKCASKKISRKNMKRVLCIETGEIYNSVKEASRQTGVNETSITGLCGKNSKKLKTAGGYHWKYID